MAYTLNQAVSIRIQGLMEQQGFTIEEVADRANISIEIIRKLIDMEVENAPLNVIYHLSEGFGISLAEFMEHPVFKDVSSQ